MIISVGAIKVYRDTVIIVGIVTMGLLPIAVFTPFLEFFVAIGLIYILIAAIFAFVVYFMKEDGGIITKEEENGT